ARQPGGELLAPRACGTRAGRRAARLGGARARIAYAHLPHRRADRRHPSDPSWTPARPSADGRHHRRLCGAKLLDRARARRGVHLWCGVVGFATLTLAAGGWAATADLVRHAILPVSILAAIGAAGIARYARSSVADVLGQDFVRTVRAKGAAPRRVYFRHVLAAVLPALIVLFALSLPGLVAGSIFVEAVFAWPGMGRL